MTAVNASAGKTYLRLDDVRDWIVSEEICIKESSPNFGVALNAGSKDILKSKSSRMTWKESKQ